MAYIHQSKEMHTKWTQKTEARFVDFYDIRPGNGVGLFSKKKISKGGDRYEKVKKKG